MGEPIRLSEMERSPLNGNGRTLLWWLRSFKFFNPKRVQVFEDTRDCLVVRMFTDENVYRLHVTDSYLGCTASRRKPRPGEDWTRGSDLPDGEFGYDTFVSILGAIVCYELKDVVKPPKEIDETVEGPSLGEEWTDGD